MTELYTSEDCIMAHRELSARLKHIDKVIASIDRKRSWRVSEKAFAKAKFLRDQDASKVALKVLEPRTGLDPKFLSKDQADET
mgnify:CR=1 FL=1